MFFFSLSSFHTRECKAVGPGSISLWISLATTIVVTQKVLQLENDLDHGYIITVQDQNIHTMIMNNNNTLLFMFLNQSILAFNVLVVTLSFSLLMKE